MEMYFRTVLYRTPLDDRYFSKTDIFQKERTHQKMKTPNQEFNGTVKLCMG